jgi:hypothetical protein
MEKNRDARRAARIDRIRALEQQHREAVETGDTIEAAAILAQGEALYEGIIEEEKRSIETIKIRFEAEAKLFELNLKATIKRMQRRNLEQEES